MACICKQLPNKFNSSTQHAAFDLAPGFISLCLKSFLDEFSTWFSVFLDIQTRYNVRIFQILPQKIQIGTLRHRIAEQIGMLVTKMQLKMFSIQSVFLFYEMTPN